ncbi:MAG: response regulator [Desulfosporosinus sp.]|jgi:signal transduction histidine kinase
MTCPMKIEHDNFVVPDNQKSKILLIDDRQENLLCLEAVLKSPDYQLVFANSGENALRCLLKDDFAVILLDIQMPGMDGFETARLIRARKRSAMTPIIFITAIYKNEKHIKQGYELGAIDYVFKPFQPNALKWKVAAFVNRHLQNQQLMQQRNLQSQCMNQRLEQYEKEFRQLSEQVQKVDSQKKEFISILSHELRNPLTSITASISLQKLVRPGGEEDRKARTVMERQTAQLSRLVNDLLDINRFTKNKITLKKEYIELNKLVQQATMDYQEHFIKKGVSLITKLAVAPIFLKADPVRLTQAIDNLLHNAVKFTNKGDKTVLMVAHDKKTSEAILTVQDTGIGVNPEILPNLFEPFMQADNSLDRSNGGLGLGLTIVKEIVEMHNGSVDVHSEGIGQGTTLTLRLPSATIDEQGATANYLEPRLLRILIIDDIPDITEIMCSLISYLGHEAISASNGPEGITKAKEFNPDVLICDIGLPGMSGYEVARSFRNDNELKDVYLISLSGYAQSEDFEQSKAAGFYQHLAKPVDLDTLKVILAEAQHYIQKRT